MNIAVIGVGSRGLSLIQLAVQHGHTVAMFDVDSHLIQRAQLHLTQVLDRQVEAQTLPAEKATQFKQAVIPAQTLEQCADADLILDCTPEHLEMKKALFEKLDRFAGRTTILANTSPDLSMTLVASAAKRYPERILGLYFSLPIPTHPLVQLVTGDQTAKDIVDRTVYFVRQLNKQVVTIKDSAGLVIERLTVIYGGEALRILGEGQVNAATLDKLMGALGIEEPPLALMDRLGIDVFSKMTQDLYEATVHESRYRPHRLLQKMLHLNHLGRKTKQGFHTYSDE